MKILEINHFAFTLLILPVIACALLYFWKLAKSNKDILFGEVYLFLMILSFCGYILLHYRIHHSYKYIDDELILDSILLFYFFLVPFSLIYFMLQYKKFNLFKINFNFINKLSNFFKNLSTHNSDNKNVIRAIFFISVGLVFALINRSQILICDSLLLNYLYSNYSVLLTIFHKIHTISFFGIFVLMLGMILLFNEISKKKIIYSIFYYILILPFYFWLILSQGGGSGLIIVYLLIVILLYTKNNKNIFQLQIIYLFIAIFFFLGFKYQIRANIYSSECRVGFQVTPATLLEALQEGSQNFNVLKYNNEAGTLVNVSKEVSPLRYRVVNILERIDFLQMLAQTKMLIDNNELKYKKGETYLNREINWKKKFGIDIKQTYPHIPSAFNMPAIVESYYNFGVYGILIFSIISGIICVTIFKIINYYKNNFYLQSIIVVGFSNLLIHENDFIFGIKNVFYCFILLITLAFFIELFFKTNHKKNLSSNK